MRKLLIVAVLALAVIGTGCRLDQTLDGLVAQYEKWKPVVQSMCTDGTLSATTCDLIRQKEVEAMSAYAIARDSDASRKDLKAAIDELQAILDAQDAAIVQEATASTG